MDETSAYFSNLWSWKMILRTTSGKCFSLLDIYFQYVAHDIFNLDIVHWISIYKHGFFVCCRCIEYPTRMLAASVLFLNTFFLFFLFQFEVHLSFHERTIQFIGFIFKNVFMLLIDTGCIQQRPICNYKSNEAIHPIKSHYNVVLRSKTGINLSKRF